MATCPMGAWLEAENASVNLQETIRVEIRPHPSRAPDLWQLVAVGQDGGLTPLASGDRDLVESLRIAIGKLANRVDPPCYITMEDLAEEAERVRAEF